MLQDPQLNFRGSRTIKQANVSATSTGHAFDWGAGPCTIGLYSLHKRPNETYRDEATRGYG